MQTSKIFLSLILTFVIGACSVPISPDALNEQNFKSPSLEYRVHTWWHWNGGIITREGITKDLESMSKQGVSQATILNIGANYNEDFGIEKVLFNSEEWYNMFKWSLDEAKRLGIKIGVHNCDGWSTSGGPWNTPEMAVKKYVFTKTLVSEKQKDVILPKPICETDFYRDVAVIAYKKRNEEAESETYAMPGMITVNDSIDGAVLFDGDPQTKIETKAGYVIDIENPTRATKTKIDIFQNYVGVFFFMSPPSADYIIKVSNDKVHYKEIAKVSTKDFFTPEIFDIPATNARYFKIVVDKTYKLRPWHHMGLSEIQLLSQDEQPFYLPTVDNVLEKSSSVRVFKEKDLNSTNENLKPSDIIPEDGVIDLTDKLQNDGTLNWTSPEGIWEVIRFGYTSAKAYNISSSKEGYGLEVDKMDTVALNHHFNNFSQKLINKAGDLTGNTFKFLLIDSWEAGYQTWTHSMEDKFEKQRGYDLTRWIPVLCGKIVGSEEKSNAFLYDFRNTIADLIELNFYQHFKELCQRNGLELHAEAIYGNNYPAPPIDVLKVNGLMDMPMSEFWVPLNNQNLVTSYSGKKGKNTFAAYAPNFYNIKSVGAEAFTGNAHYSESYKDLKLLGDNQYCAGISQMVLHSYAHQPNETQPGFTLGNHASHFNRHYPVWQNARGWIDYQSRIQYALQETKIPASILYYLGEQFPQFMDNDAIKQLPYGYQSVPCNQDILLKLKMVDGRMSYSNDQNFDLLVLPDQKYLSFDALKQIENLTRNGATIYGNKLENMLSLSDRTNHTSAFLEMADKLWLGYAKDFKGKNNYGKGEIIWGTPIDDVLSELDIKPDFTTQMDDSRNIMFIHKNKPKADVFFVVNQLDSTINRECFFNTNYGSPEIWDPMTGEVKNVAVYERIEGGILIPLRFKPSESLIFVFKNDSDSNHFTKVEKGEKQLFPSVDGVYDDYIPLATINKSGEFQFASTQDGKYTFYHKNGDDRTMEFSDPEVFEINDIKGTIALSYINTDRTDTIEIKELKSFTEYDQPEIKYFSGMATYSIRFNAPASFINNDTLVYLSLGEIEATAKISLNDEPLGYVWTSDFMIPVNKILKENNRIEIELGTTVRNRFIGDYNEYGKAQNVWSSANVTSYLNKASVLKPTGLMEPLILIKYAHTTN